MALGVDVVFGFRFRSFPAHHDRKAPPYAERLVADAQTGRRLPSLVFVAIDHREAALDQRLVVTGLRNDLTPLELLLDIEPQNSIEHLVRRQ